MSNNYKFNNAWNQASSKILEKINTARQVKLQDFSIQELEAEILNRQKCQFGRLACTEQAEDYLIKPFNYQKYPTCFNCKQDILILLKSKDYDLK